MHGCGFDAISDGAFDLVLNATSASLQDDDPADSAAASIGPATLCYDMAYGKGDTAFTRWSKSAGAGRAETGWGMLVEQAAEVVPALARHQARYQAGARSGQAQADGDDAGAAFKYSSLSLHVVRR